MLVKVIDRQILNRLVETGGEIVHTSGTGQSGNKKKWFVEIDEKKISQADKPFCIKSSEKEYKSLIIMPKSPKLLDSLDIEKVINELKNMGYKVEKTEKVEKEESK